MERVARFLRSVIPADPAQLLLLVGVIFLLVAPRLSWRAAVLAPFLTPGSRGQSGDYLKLYSFVSFGSFVVLMAGLVAFYTCFWPGRTPVRRVLLGVLLPGSAALAFMVWILADFSEGTSSMLETRSISVRLFSWIALHAGKFPPGVYFLLFALLLISIFAVRLPSGASSLPLALPGDVVTAPGDENQWFRERLLVFVLIGLIALVAGLPKMVASIVFYLPLGRTNPHAASEIFQTLEQVLFNILFLAVSFFILGRCGWNTARGFLRLPKAKPILIALGVPLAIYAILPTVHFFYDRGRWAVYYYGKEFIPRLSDYFDWAQLGQPWVLTLVFGAFAEEIIFRGILLPDFSKRYGVHRAIFLTGIAWAAIHFRSDSYAGLGVAGVLLTLLNRILFCLAMNYVLAWMTLQWKTIVPAVIAHTVWNMLVFAPVSSTTKFDVELVGLFWMIIAYVLFHYWPINEERQSVSEVPEPNPELAV